MNSVHKVFFFLLLLFLPTQLGFHFWPDWAMVLGRRVDYLSPVIYLTDILVITTLIGWFISRVFVVSAKPASAKVGEPGTVYDKRTFRVILASLNRSGPGTTATILAVFVYIILNIFFAANTPVAIYKWLKAGEFALLGWYIVKTKPPLSTIATPLFIGVFYSSIIAIVQFVLQHSIGGPLWLLGERTFSVDTPGISRFHFCQLSTVTCQLSLRPYATFPHPNVLGGFLAVTLPLLLRLKKNLPRRQAGTLFYISFSLGVIALILTFSRSAWIVGLVAVVVMIAKNKRLIMILALIPTVFVLMKVNPLEESVVVRQQLNGAAIKLWAASPLVGVGLGNFLVELPKMLPSKSVYFLQPVHNIYLLILAETGVVGFILFCWLLWKVFLHPFSIYHLSFTILLILGLVDHYPLSLQQGQLLLTLLVALSIVN